MEVFGPAFVSHLFLKFPTVWSPLVQESRHRNLYTHHGKKLQVVINRIAKKQMGRDWIHLFQPSPKRSPSQKKQQETRYPFRSSQVAGFSSNSSGYHGLRVQRHSGSQHRVPVNSFREGQSMKRPFCPGEIV